MPHPRRKSARGAGLPAEVTPATCEPTSFKTSAATISRLRKPWVRQRMEGRRAMLAGRKRRIYHSTHNLAPRKESAHRGEEMATAHVLVRKRSKPQVQDARADLRRALRTLAPLNGCRTEIEADIQARPLPSPPTRPCTPQPTRPEGIASGATHGTKTGQALCSHGDATFEHK